MKGTKSLSTLSVSSRWTHPEMAILGKITPKNAFRPLGTLRLTQQSPVPDRVGRK